MLRTTLILAFIAAVPSLAAAQPSLAQPARVPASSEAPVVEQYNPDTALLLSVGGTLAAYGAYGVGVARNNSALATIGGIGTIFAPSFGHWYSGHVLTRGIGIRALGFTAVGAGVVVALSQCPIFGSEDRDGGSCDGSPVAAALVVGGVAAWVIGSVDDILTAPGEARRRNRELATQLTLAPVITPHQTGLALAGTF